MGIKTITVIGAGTMGHGIAQNYALAGYDVHLYDIKDEFLSKGFKSIEASLDVLIEEGVIEKSKKEFTLNHLRGFTDLKEAVKDADFITEAAPESLELKHDLYKEMEKYLSEHAIIASNTSTFSIEQLTETLSNKSRFLITHFFNPAQLVPLVEIVKTNETSETAVEAVHELMKKIGKKPIVLKKDIEGFVANRLQAALVREAFYLLEEGVADAESIDTAITSGPGFRWAFTGPLETADFGGLDIWKKVVENLAPDLSKAEKIPSFIQEKIDQNLLGTKTGEGIYSYSKEGVQKRIEERDLRLIGLGKIKEKTKK